MKKQLSQLKKNLSKGYVTLGWFMSPNGGEDFCKIYQRPDNIHVEMNANPPGMGPSVFGMTYQPEALPMLFYAGLKIYPVNLDFVLWELANQVVTYVTGSDNEESVEGIKFTYEDEGDSECIDMHLGGSKIISIYKEDASILQWGYENADYMGADLDLKDLNKRKYKDGYLYTSCREEGQYTTVEEVGDLIKKLNHILNKYWQ